MQLKYLKIWTQFTDCTALVWRRDERGAMATTVEWRAAARQNPAVGATAVQFQRRCKYRIPLLLLRGEQLFSCSSKTLPRSHRPPRARRPPCVILPQRPILYFIFIYLFLCDIMITHCCDIFACSPHRSQWKPVDLTVFPVPVAGQSKVARHRSTSTRYTV